MSKYDREIIGRDARGKPTAVTVDVYRVLEAFDVTSAPLQHLAKKALCAGLRGHKDRKEDYADILLSAQKAVDMLADEEACAACGAEPRIEIVKVTSWDNWSDDSCAVCLAPIV